jgi:hypothetical protein
MMTTDEDFQGGQDTGSDPIKTKHHAARRGQLVCGLQTSCNLQFGQLVLFIFDWQLCFANLDNS